MAPSIDIKRSPPDFIELFAKTNYSFLEGASHPEEMVTQAFQLGYRALGITDRNGVYGAPRAHAAAKEVNLKLIIGSEVFIDGKPVFLLARNRQGYGDLCELLTQVHCELEEKATWKKILEWGRDLFLILPVNSVSGEEKEFPTLKRHFGDRLYFAVSCFRDGHDTEAIGKASELSRRWALPCLATNQPLFHVANRKALQDVVGCIRYTCTLENGGFRLLPNDERHLKGRDAMARLFAEYPQWLSASAEVAERCQFSLDEITYHYPTEWIPAGETGDSFLAKLVRQGAEKKYGTPIPVAMVEQIEHELELIADLQYSDYFLTIWDIVQFARSRSILCQGRGSAANSIVCFLLGITSIDPVRMNLLFERFISRERREPPDIDIDFEHERREEVIQYIYERYGRNRAAITAEVICYRRRSALREVAKVFSFPSATVDKLLILTQKRDLREFSAEEFLKVAPEIDARRMRHFHAQWMDLLAFPRHLGTHVGGFVLCHDLLTRNVPVEKAAMPNRTIVQWDKNDLDALGFVRVDVLGLGILTCIRKTFEHTKAAYGKTFSLATVPAEDAQVYASIRTGDTVGVFQIESRAQMNMLPRLKPRTFYDLVVEISLVRPGPIQGKMVHPYLRRRAGLEPVVYPHPELEAILKKTYGVPLFQEQIMKMAMQVAGFSAGEADELRRAMGTWRRHGGNRLSYMGDKFCRGLIKKGISEEFAARIFSQIEGFAEYGFPESHAASFAILAYVSAYLHFYFPDAFLCGILNSQPMGFYQNQTLVYDAERHGVKALGIDVTKSDWDNRIEAPSQVRLGFREIRGFPEKTGQAIEAIRGERPFASLLDFVTRLKDRLAPKALTKRELFLLAGANGFESLGHARREAWWEIQALPLQDSHMLTTSEDKLKLPREREWERITLDYQAQGMSLYSHPMAYFRGELQKRNVLTSEALKPPASRFLKSKRQITVAGIVICRQMPPTASGVLFITLEDEFGFVNLVIWNAIFQKFREIFLTQSFLICEGRVEKPDDADIVHVIVDSAKPLLTLYSGAIRVASHDFG